MVLLVSFHRSNGSDMKRPNTVLQLGHRPYHENELNSGLNMPYRSDHAYPAATVFSTSTNKGMLHENETILSTSVPMGPAWSAHLPVYTIVQAVSFLCFLAAVVWFMIVCDHQRYILYKRNQIWNKKRFPLIAILSGFQMLYDDSS